MCSVMLYVKNCHVLINVPTLHHQQMTWSEKRKKTNNFSKTNDHHIDNMHDYHIDNMHASACYSMNIKLNIVQDVNEERNLKFEKKSSLKIWKTWARALGYFLVLFLLISNVWERCQRWNHPNRYVFVQKSDFVEQTKKSKFFPSF